MQPGKAVFVSTPRIQVMGS